MPRVPAHTNAVGYSLLRTTAIHWSKFNPESTNAPVSTSTTPHVAQSSKSPSADGIYHSTFKGFRKATAYSRGVQRLDSLTGYDFVTLGADGKSSYFRYWGENSLNPGFHGFPTTGPVTLSSGVGTGVSLNTRNRATAEALLKLQDMKVSLSTALGEAARTFNMLATRITQLVRVVLALSDGKWSYAYWLLFGVSPGVNPRKFGAASASSLWLEWQYGWKPLISDIWGGVEQLQQGFREGNLLFNVARTIRTPLNPRSFFSSTSPQSYVTTKGEAWESSKVSLWGAVTNSKLAAFSQLGLINPATLVWELTRFSFVIDWLIPIGNWLESLTATVGISFVDGSRVDMVYADVEGTIDFAGTGSGAGRFLPRVGKLPRVRNRVLAMQRTVYGSWPWALPYWKNPFSSTHMTSALALLRQSSRR